MSTHPAEAMDKLSEAHAAISRLITDAEKRGDTTGAQAWGVALRAVEHAERAVGISRREQTWRQTPDEQVRPRSDLPCFACKGVATEQHTCVGFIP